MTPARSPELFGAASSSGVKRKAVTDLDELEPGLARVLQRYMPARVSAREKLSRLQLAFLEMQMDEMQIKGTVSSFQYLPCSCFWAV